MPPHPLYTAVAVPHIIYRTYSPQDFHTHRGPRRTACGRSPVRCAIRVDWSPPDQHPSPYAHVKIPRRPGLHTILAQKHKIAPNSTRLVFRRKAALRALLGPSDNDRVSCHLLIAAYRSDRASGGTSTRREEAKLSSLHYKSKHVYIRVQEALSREEKRVGRWGGVGIKGKWLERQPSLLSLSSPLSPPHRPNLFSSLFRPPWTRMYMCISGCQHGVAGVATASCGGSACVYSNLNSLP